MLAIRKIYTGGRRAPPKGMQGAEILAQYKDSKAIKDEWIPLLEECYRWAVPYRNNFYEHTTGKKRNREVYDNTAVQGVASFATKMQSILVPPWREFSRLSLGPAMVRAQRDSHDIQEQLSIQNDILFTHVNHSNFGSQVHESLQDLAIGTGSYDIMSGQLGQAALQVNAIPMNQLVLEEGPNSTIETTYRDLRPAARNIERIWSGAQLPPELALIVRDKPAARIDILESVIFDPLTGQWQGAATWKAKKIVIWRRSLKTNPRIVTRWSPGPDDLYGRGPVMQVLPDIKTTNKVTEFILRNAALSVAGMYTATQDSALNPYNFKIIPGGVVPVPSNRSDNPTIKALERTGDLRVGFEVLERLQNNIKRALFSHLRDPSDPVRSATEIAIDDRELVDTAGSSMGRQQTELVEQTIKRFVDILSQRGAMADIKVDGHNVTLKHTSPLAKAQDMDDMLALERTMNSVPPEALAVGIKVEDIAAWIGEKTGLDPRLIRDPAERAEVVAKADEVMQQQAAESMQFDNDQLSAYSFGDFVDGSQAKEHNELNEKQALERASRYRETFSTDSGKYVLQDMIRLYYINKIVQTGDDLQTMGIRQGTTNVVNDILILIEMAKTGGNPQ